MSWIFTQENIKKLIKLHPEIHLDVLSLGKFSNDNARIIPKEKRYEILKRQKWRCNSCGCILKYGKFSKWQGETAHIDHIFPYSKKEEYTNGKDNINELANLQALCPNCNFKKGDSNGEKTNLL